MHSSPPAFIKLLAHDLRWHMLKALTVSDLRVQELMALVNEPVNLVSYHLKKLRDDGVVTTRRSEADGRDVYYSVDINHLRDLHQAAGNALHPGIVSEYTQSPLSTKWATKGSPATLERDLGEGIRVLFICTHNSARSQMAEGLMRHLGRNRVEVHSAGNHPTQIHADAIRAMDALGIDIRGQQPKDVDVFAGQQFDYVITVCDKARETCPTFPGTNLHWGFADPATIEDVAERSRTFDQIARVLAARIENFLTAA